MRTDRLVLCASLAVSFLLILSPPVRAQDATEISADATDVQLSELLSLSKDLGSLQKGTWEIVASVDAGVTKNGTDGHQYVVFDALGPWTIGFPSLKLANTSSVLVALGNLDTGSSDYLGFRLVDSPAANLFGQFPSGRYFFRVTPKDALGGASYVAHIRVSPPDEQEFTLASSTSD